jgi:hypothetical protein
MRGMERLQFIKPAGFVGLICVLIGAAPAPPSYLGVERTIDNIRQSWSSPGAAPQPNRAGWDVLFDALLDDLKAYGKADSESSRLESLDRIYQISNVLGTVPWTPAATLREEIRQWLRPRLRLASAARTLKDTVSALPASPDANVQSNRTRWVDFVQNELGSALRDYDAADTVGQRQGALHRITDSLGSLRNGNQTHPWGPSWELEGAMNDLFNRPNIDVAADVNTVAPFFDNNLVETGPVFRKGYWSQVTAGPKTGFGLLASDDGIAFFNKQTLVSVTPITDFQNQIAADAQGQRAAKLYQFSATSYDWSELTITTVLRPSGLTITPASTHNIDAAIASCPTQGNGLARGIAGLIGMNQSAINQRVKEGALPKLQQQIPAEAQEEALERIAQQTAERNADLRAKGLVGNNTVAVKDVLIKDLSLRSRPDGVFVGGLFQWRGAPGQIGADAPQPPALTSTFEPGITADVHLSSLITSAAAGIYQRGEVSSVHDLMITIKDAAPGTPPADSVKIAKNVDFPTYIKAVDESRKPESKANVLRITRPSIPPEFSVDAKGNLVALFQDLQVEVPAPESEAKGGVVGAAAKIYRIKMPQAEIALTYTVETAPGNPPQLHAKVADFNPGPKAEVLAITDDETKAIPLSRFSASLVLGSIGGRLRSQPINVSLAQINLPGLSIRSVSPLDPSGWVRVGLQRNPNATQLAQAVPSTRVSEPVAVAQPTVIVQPPALVTPQPAVIAQPVATGPAIAVGQP